jgi:hypothetical protein
LTSLTVVIWLDIAPLFEPEDAPDPAVLAVVRRRIPVIGYDTGCHWMRQRLSAAREEADGVQAVEKGAAVESGGVEVVLVGTGPEALRGVEPVQRVLDGAGAGVAVGLPGSNASWLFAPWRVRSCG